MRRPERHAAKAAARKAEKHRGVIARALARCLPRCEGTDAPGEVCASVPWPRRRRRSHLPLAFALAGLGAAYAPPPAHERRWWR